MTAALTATMTAAPPEVADPLERPFRLTVERYYRMIEAGILTEKDPIYLWKGRLVEKMPKGPGHIFSAGRLTRTMNRLVPDGWFVQQEQPMALPDDGVPEPDLTIVRGVDSDYKARLVTARDVAIVAEVSDSTLKMDQRAVLEAYAAAMIPIYWIVNLRLRRVEVYTDPEGEPGVSRYRTMSTFGPDQEVPVVLDGREVGRFLVQDILP